MAVTNNIYIHTENSNITPETLPALLRDLAEVYGVEVITNACKVFQTAVPKNGKYVLNQRGLTDEARVIDFLRSVGAVTKATVKEDRLLDIDCYLDGVPVSIKAQHTGAKYRNIYFELATYHRNYSTWRDRDWEHFTDAARADSSFTCDYNGVRPSWFYTGAAETYAILQGDRLRLYRKEATREYIETNGFLRVRGLSWKVLQTQSGVNSFSGYLDADAVPCVAQYTIG